MVLADTVEWACVLCGPHIQNDWMSRAMNLHPNLYYAWVFLCGNFSDDSEGFRGRHNVYSANKSVAQMLQRWLRISWKWSRFRKVCNKQSTWECGMRMGWNQQRSVTDSARLEADPGIPKVLCLRLWCRVLAWNMSWQNLFCGFATRAEGTSCCGC